MKIAQYFAVALMLIGIFASIFFCYIAHKDGFTILGDYSADYAVTGQIGDFFGGVVGTVFGLAGTLLIYMTFRQQGIQNEIEGFESTFFEMIRLHRANVVEMSYTAYDPNSSQFQKAENRKVFKAIYNDFLECYREIRHFSNSKDINDYLLPKYKRKLELIVNNINPSIDLLELALVDIAYQIVFFGVSHEGEIILRGNFQKKYCQPYFHKLLKYIRLKPKRENNTRWTKWEELKRLPYVDFKRVNEKIYTHGRSNSGQRSASNDPEILYYFPHADFAKYYGGHQHRLGHYFRHLFQSFTFVNFSQKIQETDKYSYAKILRSQLSTYEQALLFVNSLSSLGWMWEYDRASTKQGSKKVGRHSSGLISRYNLIKNLPGLHSLGLRYRTYYPDVEFE